MTDYTLCWDCANATDFDACPWSDCGEPVPGWIAKPAPIQFKGRARDGKYQKTTESYVVYECPKFKRDAWRGGQKDYAQNLKKIDGFTMDNRDVRKLAALIITQAVEDWIALDYGRIRKMSETLKLADAEELFEFFHSEYFGQLLAVCSTESPQKVRDLLMVGDEL
jgi:hypothetical protein